MMSANWCCVRTGPKAAMYAVIQQTINITAITVVPQLSDQMISVNRLWLQDTALRVTCVMALDRFGDFVSDEVNTVTRTLFNPSP